MYRKIYILFTILMLTLSMAISAGCYFGVKTHPGYFEPQPPRSLTIMVYMNGSDLESLYGAGTNDIFEMIASGYDEDLINVVLFTGGSRQWWLDEIPDGLNSIFWLSGGNLIKVADMGDDSMGNPEVLASFVRFGQEYFPAERYGLILWNHGGGSVVGYGADERFENYPPIAMMTLSEIEQALEMSNLEDKLEFLGFDTCLMATIEMAKIARNYARYFIASAELEPEEGWDYTFLGDITPDCSGREIGSYVIHRYAEFYKDSDYADLLTMSLTDLSKMDALTDAFEAFAAEAGDALYQGEFRRLSSARRRTRNFGSGGEDGESDMVDINEMLRQLENAIHQDTALELKRRLDEAVLEKYENRNYNLGGLSVYYPFFNKEGLLEHLEIYAAMDILPYYTGYITSFARELQTPQTLPSRTSRQARHNNTRFYLSEEEAANTDQIRLTTWQQLEPAGERAYIQIGETPDITLNHDLTLCYNEELYTLHGHPVCMYADSFGTDRRTIPVLLNGKDANIIALKDTCLQLWKIAGVVPTTNGVFNTVDKKMVQLREGDRLAIRYYTINFDKDGNAKDQRNHEKWHIGEEFVVEGQLTLHPYTNAPTNLSRKVCLTDYYNNHHFRQLP